MRRVLIIGCPGAGKSTAARKLAAKTGLPLIHLDRHYWRAGWVPTEDLLWRETVISLASQECWIIDGTYGSTLAERLDRADTIIHLDFPTWLCLWRVFQRTATHYGRERPQEFVPGCPERIDITLLKFVLRYRRRLRTKHLAKLSKFPGALHSFTRPAELEAFLASLPSADHEQSCPDQGLRQVIEV